MRVHDNVHEFVFNTAHRVAAGAHFMFGMRERTNFSTESVRAWGEKEFFSSIDGQWHVHPPNLRLVLR